jgi:hypothetical protein
MQDVVHTLVGEATTQEQVLVASLAVRSHIKTGRKPEISQTLVQSLLWRTLALTANGALEEPQIVAQHVMQTVMTDPR